MKCFLGLLLLCCCMNTSKAQKLVVMDKAYKEPIFYADSLTTDQQNSNKYFVVEKETVDTFYAAVQYVKTFLQTKQDTVLKSLKFSSLSTTININGVLFFAFGKRYNAVAKTSYQGVATSLLLSSKDNKNSKNILAIELLMNYMKSTKSLLKPVNTIQPKFYVEVIADPLKKIY